MLFMTVVTVEGIICRNIKERHTLKTSYNRAPFWGKSRRINTEIVGILCLEGSKSLLELSRSMLKREGSNMNGNDVRSKRSTLANCINDRIVDGRKKRGLVSSGHLNEIQCVDECKVQKYIPSFSSCIGCLGMNFDSEKFAKFVENMSKYYVTFSYFKEVIDSTSYKFFKTCFLIPIRKIFDDNMADFERQFRLSSIIVSEAIGQTLFENMFEKTEQKNPSDQDILIEHTWYDSDSTRWKERIRNYYFPDRFERRFDFTYNQSEDEIFLYFIMERIHIAYYSALEERIPQRHLQKFPR